MVKVWELGEQKGVTSLRLAERAEPKPGPGQVVVAVKATSLNRRDIGIAGSTYGGTKPPTRIPLSDGAGDVVALGDGVTNVKVGDRVTATHFTPWLDGAFDPAYFAADLGVTIDGWLGEKVVIPAACLVPIPPALTYADAAALPVAAVTAYAVIETFGDVKSGDTVLTLGTGGVSIFALQIAKMNGARAAITSSSDEKLARCKELGADIVVNYRTRPDWDKAIREQNGGRGVDIVVETGGFATVGQSLAACAPNARVGMIGALGGRPETPPALFPLVGQNITMKGITSGSRRMFNDLLKAMVATGSKPVIDKTFAFADAPKAYQYMVDSEFIGKIVIENG
ncbi:MAG: NAD(P)-dependent alcohol dehydrogenase [Rhodospirillaceae bacterium]|nr:NAD(P)-dependent alcohol dehydrogenase [Rhodospirillaceae bacterium]